MVRECEESTWTKKKNIILICIEYKQGKVLKRFNPNLGGIFTGSFWGKTR